MTSLAPNNPLRLQGSLATESAADLALGGTCRVLAVFENATYLLLEHGHEAVVALLGREALQLPNSVRLLGAIPDLRQVLQIGDTGWVSADELGVVQVHVGGARVALIGAHKPSHVQVRTAWSAHPDDVEALAAAPSLRSRAHRLAAALDAGDPSPLNDLVGWGQGLTPAGDDLTCGVLLAMVATQRLESAHAIDLLGSQGRRTTSLSARLLRCAAQGMAVPEVVRLVDALLGVDQRVTPEQVASVHAIGHSSGRDLCAGLAGALDHLLSTPAPIHQPRSRREH